MNIKEIKEKLLKLKNGKLPVILGIAGMVLIGLSSFFGTGNKKTAKADTKPVFTDEYVSSIEKKVKTLVEKISGDENAAVVVTLETGVRYIYAGETEKNTEEKTDSGSKNTAAEVKKNYITVKTEDGGEKPLVEAEYLPEIRGVAVVCKGGNDKEIAEKIKNALMSALNITSKRIYIAGGS